MCPHQPFPEASTPIQSILTSALTKVVDLFSIGFALGQISRPLDVFNSLSTWPVSEKSFSVLAYNDEMQLVVCVVVDRDLDALLLVQENFQHGYWFPFDGIKLGETRSLAAKRIANKVRVT